MADDIEDICLFLLVLFTLGFTRLCDILAWISGQFCGTLLGLFSYVLEITSLTRLFFCYLFLFVEL